MKAVAFVTSFIVLVVLSVSAKPNSAISPYMRDAGLLYLESVESLTLDCGKDHTDTSCLREWENRMSGLEDRITIHMTKTRTNTEYFDMLKTVRWMRENWATGDEEQQEKWIHRYIKCAAHLHTVAIEGEMFDSENACQ